MTRIILPLGLLVLLTLSGFKGSKPDHPLLPKTMKDAYVWVPTGELRLEEEVSQVGGYFLSPMEVTNAEYMAFVQAVHTKGEASELAIVLPDTQQWRSATAYNEPYVKHYHSHVAYANYPVVNISHEAALRYCAWREEKLNSQAADGLRYRVRLPSRKEWVRAANGDRQDLSYAWGGPNIRNARGQALCNYKHVGDQSIRAGKEAGTYEVVEPIGDYMGVAGYLTDNADITAPVHAYWPNAFGLYNMNGNVAELLAETGMAAGGSWASPGYDVRNESIMLVEGPSPFVGFRTLVEVVR